MPLDYSSVSVSLNPEERLAFEDFIDGAVAEIKPFFRTETPIYGDLRLTSFVRYRYLFRWNGSSLPMRIRNFTYRRLVHLGQKRKGGYVAKKRGTKRCGRHGSGRVKPGTFAGQRLVGGAGSVRIGTRRHNLLEPIIDPAAFVFIEETAGPCQSAGPDRIPAERNT
jgi:hypothetical protein